MLEWRGIKKIIKAYLLPDLLKSKSLSDCTLKIDRNCDVLPIDMLL